MSGLIEKPRFDLERLLSPVSRRSPSGESLRYEGTYDEIRAARTEDDPDVSRGVWVAPLRRADWSGVEALCLQALEDRSKDLQIAAWLTEAWVHLYGFGGLRDGLQVHAALCDVFWDDLHPRPDGDDLEFRLAPFIWMNEKLPPEIKCIPISNPESADARSYCWADWEVVQRPSEEVAASGRSTAGFQQSMILTPVEFYTKLYFEVDASSEACSRLESILDNRCGANAPSLGNLSKVLTAIREFVLDILQQRDATVRFPKPDPERASQPAGLEMEPATMAASPLQGASGPIQSRADAYRRLAEAADYLSRTEPHSPTPYLVRRAIKWGSMQLTDLLPELVRNNDELREICRLLQMPNEGL